MDDLNSRVAGVLARIAAACATARRPVSDVTLIAVSKTHGPEAVRQVWSGGQRDFGESRVQEAEPKIASLAGGIRWHFIGHLQKNKVRRALPLFDLFHSVDTLAIAEAVDRIAAEEGRYPRVLLEVNVAGETSKFGFAPTELEVVIDRLLVLPRLQIEGLMTLAPYSEDAEDSRPHFVRLREFRDRLAKQTGLRFGTLSMGMSGDFEVAIEEGATLVRVGTAIFGSRPRIPAT